MSNRYPFTQKRLSESVILRKFSRDVSETMLEWHRDRQDRVVEVIHGDGWMFQRDNSIPIQINEGSTFKIRANEWHRVIKGKSDLIIKITEAKDQNKDGKNDFDDVFKKVDAILTPSTHSSAFKVGEKSNDPVSMYLNDIFTVPVNLAGLPGISIPAGLDKNNYPLGLQIIGKPFDEQNILNIAYSMEEKINFKLNIKDWWIK